MASITDNTIANKLLHAAVELFAHKGYPATSTREIVEAAGVTKPMLYYYFQSKEGLLAAALRHFLEDFYEQVRQAVARPAPPRERLAKVIWTHLDFCQRNRPFAQLFYALYFGPDDQKGLLDLQNHAQVGHELLTEAVAQAISEGAVRPDCKEDLTMALHGMINIWVMAALNEQMELDYPLAERIVDNLLRGFGTS